MVTVRVNDEATTRRQSLGRKLRRARDAAGLTQAAVAERLGCGQAKINKIETTLVGISPTELDKLLEIYGVTGTAVDELRELAEQDLRAGPARTKFSTAMAAFAALSGLEQEATEIRCWHGERIPGTLQCEAYVLKQHEHLFTQDGDVAGVLRQWTARTGLFTAAAPPRYRVVLSESSLHRLPGGWSAELLTDQVTHLLALTATHPRLELRILPFAAAVPFVEIDFQILRFDNPAQPDFAYIEHPGGSVKYHKADVLRKFDEHWQKLADAALSPMDSTIFLEGLSRKDPPDPFGGFPEG